ncbi:hypothetical protein GCM10027297_36240 [Parahaliea aestuarii]
MEITFDIFAVLLLMALGVAVFVFTTSARTYVSEPHCNAAARRPRRNPRFFVTRAESERRCEQHHSFPCEINGLWVAKDRRSGRERRRIDS